MYAVYDMDVRGEREGGSDTGAGESVASFAEDDEAAVARDVGFHHVLWRVSGSNGVVGSYENEKTDLVYNIRKQTLDLIPLHPLPIVPSHPHRRREHPQRHSRLLPPFHIHLPQQIPQRHIPPPLQRQINPSFDKLVFAGVEGGVEGGEVAGADGGDEGVEEGVEAGVRFQDGGGWEPAGGEEVGGD